MRRDIGAIAAASAMLALGVGGIGGGYSSRRRSIESIEEVEEQWVRRMVVRADNRRRRVLRAVTSAIEQLAKATGPWAHRYGYGPPPETRAVARRLRQQAAREAKRK
jgi:hypothetical protein